MERVAFGRLEAGTWWFLVEGGRAMGLICMRGAKRTGPSHFIRDAIDQSWGFTVGSTFGSSTIQSGYGPIFMLSLSQLEAPESAAGE